MFLVFHIHSILSFFFFPLLGLWFYGLSFNLFYSAPVAVSDALRKGRFEILDMIRGLELGFFFDMLFSSSFL